MSLDKSDGHICLFIKDVFIYSNFGLHNFEMWIYAFTACHRRMIDDLRGCHKKQTFSNDKISSCNEKDIVQSSSSNQD